MSLSLLIKLFNHIPCEVASKDEMNSTYVVEVIVKFYLALHEMTLLANMKI